MIATYEAPQRTTPSLPARLPEPYPGHQTYPAYHTAPYPEIPTRRDSQPNADFPTYREWLRQQQAPVPQQQPALPPTAREEFILHKLVAIANASNPDTTALQVARVYTAGRSPEELAWLQANARQAAAWEQQARRADMARLTRDGTPEDASIAPIRAAYEAETARRAAHTEKVGKRLSKVRSWLGGLVGGAMVAAGMLCIDKGSDLIDLWPR